MIKTENLNKILKYLNNLFCNLKCLPSKFPVWRQDESSCTRWRVSFQPFKHWNEKCCGFTTSGLGHCNHIFTIEYQRNCLQSPTKHLHVMTSLVQPKLKTVLNVYIYSNTSNCLKWKKLIGNENFLQDFTAHWYKKRLSINYFLNI